jgi:hypothetical protein
VTSEEEIVLSEEEEEVDGRVMLRSASRGIMQSVSRKVMGGGGGGMVARVQVWRSIEELSDLVESLVGQERDRMDLIQGAVSRKRM